MRVLLEALLAQTLPPSEIVITDGGSGDATPSIVEEYIRAGAPIKLIREKASLPGRARNVGVMQSRCNWIAFTDAGNRPEQQWLEALAQKANDGAVCDVVYGSYQPVIDSFFKECAAIAYVSAPVETEAGQMRSCSIVSALMRREVWSAVGGFPEDLRSAEDLLFMRKIEEANFQIVRASDAIVHWDIQPDLWGTFKRFVKYSRNNIRAGLWHEWQSAIFLRYGMTMLATMPVFVVGARWLFVPLILWLGMITGRAVLALRRNRLNYPARHLRNFARLCLLVPILTVLDAAAFVGSVNWLLLDKLSLGGRG